MNATDRYLGCMIGLAIGDALGYPVEFQHSPRVTDMTSPLYSDDTQMSIATAQGILRGGSIEDVHRAYLGWLKTQSDRSQARAPGGTCLSALASGVIGTIADPINDRKGCGGVMRVAPAGLVFKPGTAFRKGAEYAAITHGHPSGYLSAGYLAELISRLIEGATLDAALDATTSVLKTYKNHDETLAAVREARRLAADPDEARSDVESLGGGWVGEEALAIAMYCTLRFPADLSAGVLAAVNHGGDSDSTGCFCGAVLGTMLGVETIPPRWVQKVENAQRLRDLAAALSALPRIGERLPPVKKVKCPVCDEPLQLPLTGTVSCPHCKTKLTFDGTGRVVLS